MTMFCKDPAHHALLFARHAQPCPGGVFAQADSDIRKPSAQSQGSETALLHCLMILCCMLELGHIIQKPYSA